MEATMAQDFDVIVVGAGMAGLTAARALGEGGLRVLVVEARERGRRQDFDAAGGDRSFGAWGGVRSWPAAGALGLDRRDRPGDL